MNNIVHEDIEAIIASNCIDWRLFDSKTVLITGANGMLPSYMALTFMFLNRYHKLNVNVILLVRNRHKAENVFGDYINADNISCMEQDVCEPIIYSGPIDFIIHAASQASPIYFESDPVGTARSNIIGTDNLLRLAKEKSVTSFLYFSSSTIYGFFNNTDIVLSEQITGEINPLNVNSCYFEGKRMGENLCVSYHYQFGIPAKIVRIFHTIGPGIDINDGRAFSYFCKCILENKDIILKTDGSAKRTFLYVTDAVKAYFIVMMNGKSGEAYNVGSVTQEISIIDLAQTLCQIYNDKKLSVIVKNGKNIGNSSDMSCPVNRIIPNTDKLNQLGWHETISWQDAFMRTITSKKENNPK